VTIQEFKPPGVISESESCDAHLRGNCPFSRIEDWPLHVTPFVIIPSYHRIIEGEMKGNFSVGEHLVSPSLNSISRFGTTSHIEPKAMHVLICLAEKAGQVISKEDLIQSVWARAFVTDDVLTGSVSALRKAFGDSAREPRFIETIPKNGYRLIAPVTWSEVAESISTQKLKELEQVKTTLTAPWSRGYLAKKISIAAVCILALALVMQFVSRSPFETSLATIVRAQDPHLLSRNRETQNPEAFRLYLMGRHYWNKRTKEGLDRAASYFQQSIDKDPTFAMAYAGLADTYNLMDEWGSASPRESFPRGKAAAMKALELDGSLAEAHASLAYVLSNYDWEWTKAENEFQTALRLNPNYATAHQWYAMHLASLGRFKEATIEIQKAQELDPLSSIIGVDAGEILYAEGHYAAAIEQYKKTLEFDPTFAGAHSDLARAYERAGEYRDALEELQKASKLNGVELTQGLSRVYAKSGYRGVLIRRIQLELEERSKGRNGSALEIASNYLALGQRSEALDWLQKAYEDHDSCAVFETASVDFDALRNDIRFEQLSRRTGLTQIHRQN
jgi:DNA-binding winged helix-turn-helix (wHTH) protein/tetratricopeptide (TPR) repeat protein